MIRNLVLLVLAPLTTLAPLAGCASAPRDAGFGDVRGLVAERTGRRVVWNQGTAEDGEARRAVADLLRDELTSGEAIQIALLNNAALQATYEDLGVAQAALVQAGLLRNPIFDAEVRFVEGGGGTGLELAIVQDFLDLFHIGLRQRLAEAALEAARLRVAGEVIDLAGRVRAAFYDAQAAGQLVEMRQTVLAAAEASHDLARRLREAGNVTELDLQNERAAYEQAKVDLAAAEAEATDRRERLTAMMGLWGKQTQWTIARRLPELPADDDIDLTAIERRAVERSIDVTLGRRQLQTAAGTLGLQQSAALLGELEAGASAEREPDGEWAVGPAVAVPIPLFDQGQGRTAAARAEFRRARQQLTATAVAVRSAARAARDRLAAARDRARYYREVIVPLRHQITRQAQLQFNAMELSAFQLLDARRQEIEAGAASINALHDYWLARTRLDQLLAGRMTDLGAAATTNSNNQPGAGTGGREEGNH